MNSFKSAGLEVQPPPDRDQGDEGATDGAATKATL